MTTSETDENIQPEEARLTNGGVMAVPSIGNL